VGKAFNLCSPPTDADSFTFWITEMLESIPQVNYHEPVGTLPALPVNATCGLVRTGLSDDELLNGLGIVTTWYYGSGAAETAAQEKAAGVAGGAQRACVPENSARNLQVGGGVPGDGPDPSSSWGYQSCTETLHQFSTLPGSWRSYNFSLPSVSELCQTYYGEGRGSRTHANVFWRGGLMIIDAERILMRRYAADDVARALVWWV